MTELVSHLAQAIGQLRGLKPHFPCCSEELAAQYAAISALRAVWGSLPNSRLKDSEREDFIRMMIGQSPSEEHLRLASSTARQRRLTAAEKVKLEEKQGGRCAICGVLLNALAEPHVDHITPVSLGGVDGLSNNQLLCSKCNLGKSSSLHWLMLCPFFDERPGNEPSAALRYAVLQRHGGLCGAPNCEASASDGELHVAPRVPVSNGGRVIFDNLTVYCTEHLREYQDAQYRSARERMAGRIAEGPRFRFQN
ncbi:HNH endonuclease [Paraburkholderia largidicola]|uniref:HNH endonuclease n=1 Tax=Paraburkholderia largidicola TaxID=3014751 RepID=UPI0015DB5B3A